MTKEDQKKTNYKHSLLLRSKTVFSLLTIAVVILILLLLPRNRKETKNPDYAPPRIGSRRIPAPTPTPNEDRDELIKVGPQVPSDRLVINLVNPTEPIFIKVYKNDDLIGESKVVSEAVEDLQIDLINQTNENDVLTVKVFTENSEELFSKEVLITATALSPNVLMPKDLK